MPVNVLFITIVPIFFFLFILVYQPFGITEFLTGGGNHYTLNLLICTLIVLGVISLSRMLLFILRHKIDLNWALYVAWSFGEGILSALFMTIPLGIAWVPEMPYFTVMMTCILFVCGILIFPEAILSMSTQLYVLNQRARSTPSIDEKKLVRFYDEQQRLKLVVSSDVILYIEAEENYVHVVYLDNGRVRDFTLRSSMRALEEVCMRHGLVRCHRSFFLNPMHVDILKKDENGYFIAKLDRDGVRSIPVSRRYYESLTSLL